MVQTSIHLKMNKYRLFTCRAPAQRENTGQESFPSFCFLECFTTDNRVVDGIDGYAAYAACSGAAVKYRSGHARRFGVKSIEIIHSVRALDVYQGFGSGILSADERTDRPYGAQRSAVAVSLNPCSVSQDASRAAPFDSAGRENRQQRTQRIGPRATERRFAIVELYDSRVVACLMALSVERALSVCASATYIINFKHETKGNPLAFWPYQLIALTRLLLVV